MRSELSQIASRLKKANALPNDEKIKWSEKILDLKIKANNLAVKILIGTNREIAMDTSELRYGGQYTKFLNENDYVSSKFDKTMSKVNREYENEDWIGFLEAVSKYKDMVIEVDKLYMQNQKTGFRETIKGEEVQQGVFN